MAEADQKSMTIGGRVNAPQLDRIDAAARLLRKPRAHFVVEAVLERANEVLRQATGPRGAATDGQ